MNKEKERGRDLFAIVPAIAGALLAWVPIAFTVLTSAVGTAVTRSFHFDYLMPAELAFLHGGPDAGFI